MRDPYLYADVSVLNNRLGIKDALVLEQAEADIAAFNLSDVDGVIGTAEYDLKRTAFAWTKPCSKTARLMSATRL